MNRLKIEIKDDYIKLDQLLKLSGLTSTGGEAKNVIIDKLVMVNNEICIMRGKKIRENDVVKFNNNEIEVVKS
jgi:ribosome-associated protein